jgi:hypothetical protein
MAEVRATRFVDERPAVVERAIDPATVLEAEGTFEVVDVEETEDGWTVVGSGRGMSVPFEFARVEGGLRYEALGRHGPFREFESTVTVAPQDHGTDLSAWSRVEINLPLQAVTDRIAGWKRRSELGRLLAALSADLTA